MTRVSWGGRGSVERALEVLERFGRVELELPPDLHHTLFAHLDAGDGPPGLELLDLDGDVELLRRLARVRQLASLAGLADAPLVAGAVVSLRSPAPLVSVRLPGREAPG